MKYEVSTNIKATFILNALLLIVAVFVGETAAIAASVVIFVVISVSIEILESVHKQP